MFMEKEIDLGHWVTKEEIPERFFGFIYLITNKQNGKKYVGKKQAKTIKKLPPLKGRKNKRHKEVDTNWKSYTGSCKQLNEDIEEIGKENFTFEIVRFCENKSQLAYVETYYQMTEHVILREDFYNGEVRVRLGGNCKIEFVDDIKPLPN